MSIAGKVLSEAGTEALLTALREELPYLDVLGMRFETRGDELTAELPFDEKLIGNPFLPALHGGAIAAFAELTALTTLTLMRFAALPGTGGERPAGAPVLPAELHACLPRTIDFTMDYLRPGRPRAAWARARIIRAGRRYASVQTRAWQDRSDRPFVEARGRFLMPEI